MSEIINIAVKSETDPMDVVMDCLFKKEGEIFISNDILELMTKKHSYTKTPQGDSDLYHFHKRARGTSVFFSFFVKAGMNENRVSDIEYTTELGVMDIPQFSVEFISKGKVYIMLKGEKKS